MADPRPTRGDAPSKVAATRNDGAGACASPPWMAGDVAPDCFDPPGVDAHQARDVARWRRAERARLRGLREAMGVADRRATSEALDRALRAFLADRFGGMAGRVFSGYWPIKGEPDLRPLLAALCAEGVAVALPLVEVRAAPLVFRRWTPDTRMVRGDWGIPVPPPETERLIPQVALAPLVGWDGAGYRLGYGGGYFDRTLAALAPRPFVIGVGYEAARLATIYPQPQRHAPRRHRDRGGAADRPGETMTTTTERMRVWSGPALLAYGFRPFFLGAALWAALAMALYVPMLTGARVLPTAFDPVSWHAHEFLFGYLGAVAAGFLLTAVPSWTGRPPIAGWPLGALVGLWLVGRAAVVVSAGLPPLAVAVADLTLPVALGAVIAREIVAARNWRNLIVLALLAVFAVGNALFHAEAALGGYPAQGYGLRIGLAAALMMIAVIGGRIVPSFTRNWLVRRGPGRMPAPPMQRFDKAALLVLLAALALWVAAPGVAATGLALALAGGLHLIRLGRWAGERAAPEPLVLVLHAAYALLPLGALAVAVETLAPGAFGGAAAQHVWMAGAIGLMTLAVMTRATLGHTGRELTAGGGTAAIYLALLAALLARLAAGLWPAQAGVLHAVAGVAWIGAFGGFAALYGSLLLRSNTAG